MSKDYYKILEINEFDSFENVKSAYRRLARKWHPDIAGNTPEVLNKFKDINEAYGVLSNKVKKEEYDRARRFYNYASEKTKTSEGNNKKNSTNPQKEHKHFDFDWKIFLAKREREQSFRKEEKFTPINGKDVYADIEISTLEAITGTSKIINMLKSEVCPKCGGKKFANGTVCQHCGGSGEKKSCKKFTVKIPAGIKNGSKIRLAGEGEKGIYGGKNGDLYITVQIKENQNYKTDGLNILKTVSITPQEAVLGGSLIINTLNGNVSLKILPNTQNGQKFRLSGCGISQNNHVGDMIVTVEIRIPKNLSEEEINLYKKLAEISSNNTRDDIYDR